MPNTTLAQRIAGHPLARIHTVRTSRVSTDCRVSRAHSNIALRSVVYNLAGNEIGYP